MDKIHIFENGLNLFAAHRYFLRRAWYERGFWTFEQYSVHYLNFLVLERNLYFTAVEFIS